MERPQPASSNLMDSLADAPSPHADSHNRLVADILTRYRTLMMLATVQAEEGDRNNATPETMAVAGISMKMEFDGLYSSIKELLTLSRRIKELWVFGPLGSDDADRKAKETQIERDVARVSGLLNGIEAANMEKLARRHGGAWEMLARSEGEASAAAANGAAAPALANAGP
ncbi:hypothetical protein TOPH_08608 [Tolypocladium ophioglossoides CBS 100239]|uniref:Mediator of RNA polymerase II transcription subunit 22 n=1 Tax=Tolypocladium ophioglossoides (strain CBS 100239) TaxID=1163406 RepID=A0A0L0MY15_TOLOC|nr:hypothetical protein TOPH_08608 [Tolypocladium ophioglossoides CBS 100239]